MRFIITLNPLENKVPIGNRIMCLSLIKAALKVENEELFSELFFYGDRKNKKIKPFCFSVFLNNFKLNENYIEVKENVSITVSTVSNKVGLTIFNGFIRMRKRNDGVFEYKDYKLKISNITLIKEKTIENEMIKCKTLSPIYIKDRNGKSIGLEEQERFEEELNYISNIFLLNYRGVGLQEKLKFNPIHMKKVVIKEEIKSFKEITNKKFLYINAFSGIFILEGNKDDLKLLYQGGLGFRRSEGLGLIDLV
ncbi:CRISPR-associated endoribonuclease Cas6 [Clostridium sp.]|uniref:CRISPR-associated endoribonuclease Cas6 n=1 Tax=Clostridium sp. TaxID=1506 RepID=UPI003994E704